MSVLIRDMNMPKNCGECQLESYCSLWTEVNGKEYMHPDCPLVEIPTPHGKLVDKQEIIRNSSNSWTKDDWFNSVVNAPTVIEAEDGEA